MNPTNPRINRKIVLEECPHFDRCAGCLISFKDASSELETFKEASAFFESRGLKDLRLNIGNLNYWRTRAKLAVRKKSGKIQIGMFEGNSHQILQIPECKVHHPLINQVTEILTHWATHAGVSIYDEKTGQGLLRYLQLGVAEAREASAAKIQLALVINTETLQSLPSFEEALKDLWAQHQDLLHSIWVNFNTRRDNVILGDHWKLVYGEAWLWEQFLGREIAFHPASFMQANPEMFEKLLIRLKKSVPENSVVAEFYAGGGVIGLSVADRCKKIYFNEIVPLAELCFKESCKKLPREFSEKLTYLAGAASSQLGLLNPSNNSADNIDLVIVDPPRKGVDKILLEKIAEASHVRQLIYVSCGWKSFQKDADSLLNSGFALSSAEAFLFFPGTDQLEILAVFKRVD